MPSDQVTAHHLIQVIRVAGVDAHPRAGVFLDEGVPNEQ
jgi:hypothetical protein